MMGFMTGEHETRGRERMARERAKRGDLRFFFVLIYGITSRGTRNRRRARRDRVAAREIDRIQKKRCAQGDRRHENRVNAFYVRTGQPVQYIVILFANVAVLATDLRNRLGSIGLKRFPTIGYRTL